MVLPFDVYNGGGSLCFLSIYATLCSLYCDVQFAKATVKWFALSDEFVDFALLTTMAFIHLERYGCSLFPLLYAACYLQHVQRALVADSNVVVTMAWRIWDPGIDSQDRPPVPPHASIGSIRSTPTRATMALPFALALAVGIYLSLRPPCGRHMQLIVLQILGGMISYVYQRPARRFQLFTWSLLRRQWDPGIPTPNVLRLPV